MDIVAGSLTLGATVQQTNKMQQNSDLNSFGQWELKTRLGAGGFGEVHLWQNVSTKQEIATKRLKENNRLSEDEICKLKQRWQQEHDWMLNLQTSYIVRGMQLTDQSFVSYLNQQHAWRPLPVIIMEYCNAGDLRTHLQKPENMNGLTEFEVRHIMHALRNAIEYLHNVCRIEHRDLKPDNIVIHQNGREKCYKLTDFGFARNSSDNTILKSVVGTRHYFAVEVVDTAHYTNTVDYWSAGIIAFELMCGVLPFIPHQEMYQIIVNIKKKPYDCIAITERANENNSFQFETQIFNENRLSPIFRAAMEKWLRLALDVNYKTRGYVTVAGRSKLKFYRELDNVLHSHIIKIFCLNTCQYIYYELTLENGQQLVFHSALIDELETVTGIKRAQFYLVLPTGHPRTLSRETRLIDVFVESWQDTTDSQNPPAMLYLVGYKNEPKSMELSISNTIKMCIKLSDTNNLPMWLLEQFERHTHFLLTQEQQQLESLLSGLKDYALQVEHEVFNFDQEVHVLIEEIFLMHGREKQLSLSIYRMKETLESTFATDDNYFLTWSEKVQSIGNEILNLNTNVGQRIRVRYNSTLRRIKEEATSKFYDEWAQNDSFALNSYRTFMQSPEQRTNMQTRLEFSQNAIYNCINKRVDILLKCHIQKLQDITEVHEEFVRIKEIVDNSRKFLIKIQANLDQYTNEFHDGLTNIVSDRLIHNKSALINTCTADAKNILNPISIPFNALSQSLTEIMDFSTDEIIKEAETHMQRLSIEMDGNVNDIPTTVHTNPMANS